MRARFTASASLRSSAAALAFGVLACGVLGRVQGASAERSVRVAQSLPARIRIEAGRFTMGLADADLTRALRTCMLDLPTGGECSADLFKAEQPARSVRLRAYSIDRTEVSQRAYQRCVAAGVCAPSELAASQDGELQPTAAIRHADAQSYCRYVGGALPTEAQWERAARGDSARTFPWGSAWNPRLANFGSPHGTENDTDGHRSAAAVDAFADGRSFYGALNMAGNVAELVADFYAAEPLPGATRVDPRGPESGTEHVIRGGSFRTPVHALRVTARGHMPEQERRLDVGFRCAYDR